MDYYKLVYDWMDKLLFEEVEIIPQKDKTKLYQVTLKLSIEKPIRDLEGKLNRIRAIEGVTVVRHQKTGLEKAIGNLEAIIKFRPSNRLEQPRTYVGETLVRSINSSREVPGVKVVEVIAGSIKEVK